MIESGLNVRSEARIICKMELIGRQHEINDDDDNEDKEVLREIDLHSIRHLFVLISMCYCIAFIFSLFEPILYMITHRPSSNNMIETKTRMVHPL